MNRDLLGIVEAAYRDAPSREAWHARLLDACAVLDEGLGVILASVTFEAPGWWSHRDTVGTVSPGLLQAFCDQSALADSLARAATTTGRAGTIIAREIFESKAKTASMIVGAKAFAEGWGYLARSFGVRDCVGISGLVDRRSTFGIYVPLAQARALSPRLSRRLLLVAVHAAAARRRWTTRTPTEAWLSPTGKVHEATGAARDHLGALSLRARAIESARTRKGRSDVDSALSLWQGLIAGRWSLIERFDHDGRRYLVAKRNAPELGDMLRLSESETRVLKLCSLGHSQKYVAYTLGLSAAMVSTHLSAAMLKLGVRTRAELLSMCGVLFDPEPATQAAVETSPPWRVRRKASADQHPRREP